MKQLLILIISITSFNFYGQTAKEYYDRGMSNSELKDYKGAIQNFTKVIELKPEFAVAYLMRGYCKSAEKDCYGAIQDFTKAIQLNPKFAEAYYYRGLSKIILGKDKQSACLDFSKAGELGNKDAYDDINKYCIGANTKTNKSNTNKKSTPKGNVVKTKATEPVLDSLDYFRNGCFKYYAKDVGAIEDFTKAIELAPKYASAYYYRGLAKGMMLNDTKGACADFAKAVELGNNEAKEELNRYCK